MSSQSNQAPELNGADTSETPMTGEERFADVRARLDELLERGEISAEAFAEYSATADAALSSTPNGGRMHNNAPTLFVEVDGNRFAYRRFGNPVGTPTVLFQHFMGNLDNYDPAVTDALAAGRVVNGSNDKKGDSVFVIARFRIADYDTWKAAFDDHVEARIRHGAIGHRVFRVEGDENALTVMVEFTSHGGAVGLIRDDVSTLDAIRRGGVEGGPHDVKWQLDYVDQVDVADYSTLPFS
jgi:hypothetical protein